QNRRGRNRKAQPVSFYDSFLARQWSGGWLDGVEYDSRNDLASINKDTIGLRLKIPPGFDHCAETRRKNINPVNSFNLHNTHSPTQRLLFDYRCQFLTLNGRQQFGVFDVGMLKSSRQDH